MNPLIRFKPNKTARELVYFAKGLFIPAAFGNGNARILATDRKGEYVWIKFYGLKTYPFHKVVTFDTPQEAIDIATAHKPYLTGPNGWRCGYKRSALAVGVEHG